MTIKKETQGTAVTLSVEGRLDTISAPQLEAEIKALGNVTDLTVDFSALEYVSSAGLRVLLGAQKKMNEFGKMRVTNVNSDIMDVLEITGFTDILTIVD